MEKQYKDKAKKEAMMDKKITDKKTKYNPQYFITDLESMVSIMIEKANLIGNIEFTLKEKSQIAGIMLGFSTSFQKIFKALQDWGFMP